MLRLPPFTSLMRELRPRILLALMVGICLSIWAGSTLIDRIGSDKPATPTPSSFSLLGPSKPREPTAAEQLAKALNLGDLASLPPGLRARIEDATRHLEAAEKRKPVRRAVDPLAAFSKQVDAYTAALAAHPATAKPRTRRQSNDFDF